MLDCHIVQDLLPSHADGLVSEKTAEEITQHLQTCANCRTLYEKLQAPIASLPLQTNRKEINFLKKIRSKTSKKLLIGFAAFALVFVALTCLFAIGKPVNEASMTFTTQVEGGQWLLNLTLENSNELLVRTEPIYGEENGDGTRSFAGVMLKPYQLLASPIMDGDSKTFMFGCEVDDFEQEEFRIVLRLDDEDIVFTMENYAEQTQ